MIKRLIGIIAALAVAVILVMTVLRAGEYRSMLASDGAGSVLIEVPSAAGHVLPNEAESLPETILRVAPDSAAAAVTGSVGTAKR